MNCNLNVMFSQLVFILFLITLIGISSGSPQKPNIVVFVADDLGWSDVGFRSDQIRTPNIDTLAADGIILNNYYTSPVCSPSRSALLSNVHPIHTGLQNYVILTAHPYGMPLDVKLLPEYLKEYNYATHAVGKWHLGFYKHDYTPTYRGFDSHVGYWSGAEDYFDHTVLEDKMFWGLDFRHNLDLITNATGIYSTHYFTDRSVKIINDHNISDPLFLYMAYQSVHGANQYSRLQAPQKYIEMFDYIKSEDRRIFAAMAYAMDESIGVIVNKLNQRNMLKNTILVFISDNGGPASGFTGNAASNWPLRGVKATLWEGGIRVPAFIWSPLLNKTGYVSDAMIHVSDVMPTLLDAIGAQNLTQVNERAKYPTYGLSVWSTLSDNKSSVRSEILHNIDPIWNVSAIRSEDWKLIQGLVFPDWSGWYPPFGIGSDPQQHNVNSFVESLKKSDRMSCLSNKALLALNRIPNYEHLKESMVRCGPKPANASVNCNAKNDLCLYDIRLDPCEYNNVADKYPQVVRHLWNRILELNRTAAEPANKPRDPTCDPKLHNYAWSCWQD